VKTTTIQIAFLFAFILNINSVVASEYTWSRDSKIKPISGIILLCEGTGDECDRTILNYHIRSSPIKFLNRDTLQRILDEQNLQSSGLSIENTRRVGKIVGASHILLYKKTADYTRFHETADLLLAYSLKLINIETSEEEYCYEALVPSEKGKKTMGDSLLKMNFNNFFNVLKKHAVK